MASIKKSLSLLLSLLMILGMVVLPSPVSAKGNEEAKEAPYKVKTINGKDYKVYSFTDVFGAPAPKKQMKIGALEVSEPRIMGAVRGSDPVLDEEIPSAEWRMVDVQWATYDLQPPQMGTPIYFQIADFNNNKIIAQTHEVTAKGKYKFYKLPAWNDSDVTHDPNEWELIIPDSFKFDVRIKTGPSGDFAASNVIAIVAQKGMPLYRAEYFTNGTIPTIEAQRRNPGNKTLTVKINETNLGKDEYYSFALPIGSGKRRPTYEGRKIEVKHYGSDNDDALKVSDAGGAARVKMAMKAPGKTEFDRGGTFEDNGTPYHYEVTGDYLHPHIFTIRQDLKVNFDANKGTWKTAAPAEQTIGHSMKLADEWAGLGPITVPTGDDLTPPEAEAGKPNKKFIGWNTDKDATTALFTDNSYAQPITKDETFYAIYEDIAQGTIKVKYVDKDGNDLNTKLLMDEQFKEGKKLVPELKDNADKTIVKADALAKVTEVLKDNKPAPVFVGYKLKEVEAADTLTYKKDSFDTVKFVYEKLEDIIKDNTPDTDDDKPDGYKTVTFLPGDHGTLDGTTKYYVNPKAGKTLANVDKPTVTANKGFKHTGWDKEDTTAITNDLEVTAQYKKKVVTENPNDEDYVKVDFAAGDHGKIAEDATKEYWVLKNEEVTLVAPEVTANEGWEQKAGAEGWDKPLTANYTVDTTITAQYQYNGKDIVPQPGDEKPDVPDNFVLVEFLPGDHGTLEGTTKYWVNPKAGKTLANVDKPTVKANEDFKHTGWDKEDTTAITKALKVTAQYKKKVVTENPNDEAYVKVSFETTKGTVEGTKEYWVLKDEKVKFAVPTVNMGTITDYAFKAWNPAVAESYGADTVHKATFNYTGNDIVPQPGDEKPNVPDKFVLVEFLPGENGTLEGTTKYWVNPEAGKTLADVKKPTVKANEDFKHTGWDKEDTTAITKALKVTAQYKKKVVTENPNDEAYVKVSFETTKGTVEGTKEYWVLKDEKVKFAVPTVNMGTITDYAFKAWNPAVAESYGADTVHKATFNYAGKDIVPQPGDEKPNVPDNFVLVEFLPGDHGTLEGTTKYWVNPEAGKTLADVTKPTVTANKGFEHTGWDKADTTAITKALEVTAEYNELKSEQPKIDQPTEGDDKITGEGVPGSKIVVKDKDGNPIGDTTVNKDGKWVVPVPEDKPLKEKDKITVEQTEKDKTPNTNETTVKGKEQSSKPKVDQPSKGDDKITGEGVPGSKIVVKDKDDKPIGETTVDKDGKWEVPVPKDKPIKDGDKFIVTQEEKDKKPSDPVTVTVTEKNKPEEPKNYDGYINLEPVGEQGAKRATDIHVIYLYGYQDKTVHPQGDMTRAEAAAMVARLKNLDMSDTSKPDFKDCESRWYNSAINAVVKAGLMKGYPDGTFAPNGKITRAEFAQLIKGIDNPNMAELPFTDVAGHWGLDAISQAYANKRIMGYPDNTFKPNNDITRAEAVTILNSLFDRGINEAGLANVRKDIVEFKDLDRSHWAYYQIIEASNTHEFYRAKDGEVPEVWVRVLKTWNDFLK